MSDGITGKAWADSRRAVTPRGLPASGSSSALDFEHPRFNAAGAKKENARFERVTYNGVVVHENIEIDGPTRSSMNISEAAENPLMLQGDHGPVAFRNIYLRPLPR